MDAPITKRLIISGLTPSLSAEDISRRLSTFGTVKAADGFGLVDGVGQPRKFAYVTLETTVGKLSRCMNLLSGSTWKGAKLRFGEAKPDFAERIALANKKLAEEPPRKKIKRYGGVYAEDMTLVSPENADARPGWKVSPLGRTTRPVKMRPAHPLTEIQEEKKPKKTLAIKGESKNPEAERKKKKRLKPPDTRARRKTIDMTKYGSTHLKGMFLDLELPMLTKNPPFHEVVDVGKDSSSSSDNESEGNESDTVPASAPQKTFALSQKAPEVIAGPLNSQTLPPNFPLSQPFTKEVSSSLPENHMDIQKEKVQSLSLLEYLFKDNDDDWVGRESVGSDIDVDELVKGDILLGDEDDAAVFELVPKEATPKTSVVLLSHAEPMDDDEEEEKEEAEGGAENAEKKTAATSLPKEKLKTVTLKDLFAPRDEEAGFSLLGHLDIDVELDDDLPYFTDHPPQHPQIDALPAFLPSAQPTPTILPPQTRVYQAPLVINPKQALFFPISITQDVGNTNRARQRDVFDLVKDNGWNWRDPAVGFYRTGTDEDIKKRWEESKGDLTRDWKRRCREAVKVNRRKRGGVEADDY